MKIFIPFSIIFLSTQLAVTQESIVSTAEEPVELTTKTKIHNAPIKETPIVPELRIQEEKEPQLAGFYKGKFFLRDAENKFRFSPKIRLQIDATSAFPEKNAARKTTVFLRRARPELSFGLFQEKIQAFLGAELASKAPNITDAWIRLFIHPWFSLQFGQFSVPFTLEAMTSNKYIDFIERAAINTNLTPGDKEQGLMLFGGAKDGLFIYHVGAFNGSGQNKKNENGVFDVTGRVASKPLVRSENLFSNLQIGGSFSLTPRDDSQDTRIGRRVSKDWLQSATKKRFFASEGLIVEGLQTRFAGELSLPIDRVVLRSEAITMHSKTHRVNDMQVRTSEGGTLNALGVNLTLGYWIVGKRHIKQYGGVPKRKVIPKFLPLAGKEKEDFNVQILLRGEWLNADYSPGEKTAVALADPTNDGNYQWWIGTAGINFWWTKHLRLSFNYTFNHLSRDKTNQESIILHELGTRTGFHF